MPYLITAYTEEALPASAMPDLLPVSRIAVATLDEAWNKAYCVPGIPDTTLARERLALETEGRCGIFLTDGTLIEVERYEDGGGDFHGGVG